MSRVFKVDYIPDPDRGRPLWNAKIYVGIPNEDPTIPSNQIQLTGDIGFPVGQSIPVPQPVRTNKGGVTVYNNSPLDLNAPGQQYAIAIYDRNDELVYNFPQVDGSVAMNTTSQEEVTGLTIWPEVGEAVIGQTIPAGTDAIRYPFNGRSTLFTIKPPVAVSGPITDITINTSGIGTLTVDGSDVYELQEFNSFIAANDGDSQLAGGAIWPLSSQESAQVGDVGLSNISALRDATNNAIYATTQIVSGDITALDFSLNTATIGGDNVRLVKVPSILTDDAISWGASELDSGVNNDLAFSACIAYFGSITIPSNVTLRTASGIKLNSHQKMTFGGNAFLEPGANDIEVIKMQGDYSSLFNPRITNSGSFTNIIGIGFTPRTTLEQVGQRYNQVYHLYIELIDIGVKFQCGDFVTSVGFASGCWYNRIYGGEIRNCTTGVFFAPGLNTDPGGLTQSPATSNRNSLYDISQHFMTGTGFSVVSGADNWFYNCYYESSNNPGSLGFFVTNQSTEPVVNANEHNRFIGCGTESVTQSVEILNDFTEFYAWVGERNDAVDNWGNVLYLDGNDPSRNPLTNPTTYIQNFPFDAGRDVGKEYRYISNGIVYNGGTKSSPTQVGSQFEIYDIDFEWQTFDLAAAITNATLTTGVAKYKKEGNWVEMVVRARVGAVAGDMTLTLPYQAESEIYTAAAGGAGFRIPIMVAPAGAAEPGFGLMLSTTIVRIEAPSGGWDAGTNDFNITFRYKAG